MIAEPGRFIAGPAGTCITSVVGRAQREGRWWYYLDDGVYGSFSGQLYDHMTYPVDSLDARGPRMPSVLAGPTCDSIDVIREDIPLPELQIGDLLGGPGDGRLHGGDRDRFQFHSPREDRRGEPATEATQCRLKYWTTWRVPATRAASPS